MTDDQKNAELENLIKEILEDPEVLKEMIKMQPIDAEKN